MRRIAFLVSLLLGFVAAVGQPVAAHAEGAGSAQHWGITPVADTDPAVTANGYFVYALQPSAEAAGQVLIRNPGTSAVTVDLTAVTAETAQTGGSAFDVGTGPLTGPASWIALSEQQVTVDPGMERSVSFAVRAPAEVKPGQYLAGIAAAEAPTASDPASVSTAKLGASVTLKTRYVIAVQTNVAGAWIAELKIPTVELLDQPSGTSIGVKLENSGDTFLKPTGTVVVSDAAGTQIVDQRIEMGTFVTKTGVTYPIAWPGKPAAGTYKVSVKLGYGDGKTATYDSSFVVSAEAEQHAVDRAAAEQNTALASPAASAALQPWMVYGIAGLLLVMIVLLALNLMRGAAARKPR